LADIYPVDAPPPLPPVDGGQCSVDSGEQLDSPHIISIAITDDGFTPSTVTVVAGERYRLVIESDDPAVAHGLNIVHSDGSIVIANGQALCVRTDDSGSGSLTFAPPIGAAGTYQLVNPIRPAVVGTLTVMEP
jgi:hypothetical protein